jgi:TRAP-type mannitol/chloroaromatic compound transport system substrate-binding protein
MTKHRSEILAAVALVIVIGKVNVLKTPPEILTEFLKTWDRIATREAEKDPFFKKVLDSQRQYASVVVPAKRFLFPPYDFAANHYWPEKKTDQQN